MVAGVALLLALQGPVVNAHVNRTEVMFGDTIVLSIAVSTRGVDWVRLIDPELVGLEAVGSQQVSEVRQTEDGEERRTSRTVMLKATRVGEATIGPVVVRQGRTTSRTSPISISVGGAAPPEPGINPIVAALLERPPPPEDSLDVSLYVVSSDDTVSIGEQLDVVLIAWVPRTLIRRLRAAPTLDPPEFSGAWVFAADEATETVEERVYRGSLYDLYFHHQTVFPLSEEGFSIGRATVSYNLPLTDSFMSRELRHVVKSDQPLVAVVPRAAVPAGVRFNGSVADSLSVTVTLDNDVLNVGDATTLVVRLEGIGNVALWGEPDIRLPPGLNSYPEQGSVNALRSEGRVAGTKDFRYLVVADSVGSLPITVGDYTVFNPASGRYETIPGTTLTVIGTGPEGVRTAASSMTLMDVTGAPAAADLTNAMPLWFWLLAWGIPPLAYFALRIRPGRRTRRRTMASPISPLSQIDHRFCNVLARTVRDGGSLWGTELRDGLIASGADARIAEHAARLKDRIAMARYGPDETGDHRELEAEVAAVSRALTSEEAPSYARRLGNVALIALSLGTTTLQAQQASAERLFETGAVRLAADSFAVRATNEPALATHWYNLGVARNSLDDRAGALAAWIRAARVAPRNKEVRNVLRGNATWRTRGGPFISPVTPQEAFILALVAWTVAWLALIARRRRVAMAAFALFGVSLTASIAVGASYRQPLAIVAPEEVPLREAPFRSAPEITTMGQGDPVTVTRFSGGWLMVTYMGTSGWVLSDDVVRI